MKQYCPHCHTEIRLRDLPHQGLFSSHRVCPACSGRFTPDPDTKCRQAFCLIIALIALVSTLLLYFDDTGWLVSALASYVALGLLIAWGNRKMFLVPYQGKRNKRDAP